MGLTRKCPVFCAQVYECCLTNHNMGWPKYAQRAAMTLSSTQEEDTLAVLLYHSFEARQITLPSGSTADLKVSTEYPFRESISITVATTAGLTLALRIPGWADKASIMLANGTTVRAQPATLFQTRVPAGTSQLELTLPMEIWVENRTAGAVAVHRGPLLFAHNVEWAADHSARNPTGQCAGLGLQPVPRNRSFLCDIGLTPRAATSPQQIAISNATKFVFRRRTEDTPALPPGRGIFSSFLVPVDIVATSADGKGSGFTMIPYGATDLRITELVPAAAPPPLPPPLVYPATTLEVSGPEQLPFLPTAFNGSWPAGKMDGPAVTDNSEKDRGFITLRSGAPKQSSAVLVYPKIRATAAHRLKSVGVRVRYETGYTGFNGPNLTIVATVDGDGSATATTAAATLLSHKNLTGYSFDKCHEQRCYSPPLAGTGTFGTPAVGDVQLEIMFANAELNVQLLLPFEFELTWAHKQD
eukprot:SAG22_NODE_754_length_7443_cov_4.952478_4_plen_471_part_00